MPEKKITARNAGDGDTTVTVSEKLVEMRRDLSAMVTFFNKDESFDVASQAQAALQQVVGLSNTAADYGADELDWPPSVEDIQK